ncbi:MAG: RluA family pseudouridine synthase [Anaerolineaceae bacterium]|nr:RluA family pseudouridine synthase [Anaerolineaceae bacterium]
MDITKFIVFIDSWVILINKPSGLRTIPDGYDKEKENLHSLLKKVYPEIMTVHRLDKDTSGLIIFARDKDVHKMLNLQFEKRLINKKYFALVHNFPDWNHIEPTLHLLIDGDRKHRTIIHQSGKPATTHFSKIEVDTTKNISLIEAIPKTGYTHQIRSQLSHIGFPILGDILYAKDLSSDQKLRNKQVSRMMLHAASLEFSHPETNRITKISSNLPFSISEI